MSDKPITWQQGIAVVGGAFGLCCMGFMLLHGMIIDTRAEAASNLRSSEVEIKDYLKQNSADHAKIMDILMSIKRAQ